MCKLHKMCVHIKIEFAFFCVYIIIFGKLLNFLTLYNIYCTNTLIKMFKLCLFYILSVNYKFFRFFNFNIFYYKMLVNLQILLNFKHKMFNFKHNFYYYNICVIMHGKCVIFDFTHFVVYICAKCVILNKNFTHFIIVKLRTLIRV